MASNWQHLFEKGEYVARRQLLGGLTLDQVVQRPSNELHTIYEEMWHLATWQHVVVHRDEGEYENFPTAAPVSIDQWSELVEKFFADLQTAYSWTAAPEKLSIELDPGVTMEDALHSLAVHNAYHFGKIVALRQMIGAWPPANL